MIYKEVYKDLFSVGREYYLGHCVAVDGKMGAGIAKVFCQRNPNLRKTFQNQSHNLKVSDVFFYDEERDKMLNLITKQSSYGKPTRATFNNTIVRLKEFMIEYNMKKLAIPLIGSGLDKLDWNESRKFIQETFADTDIEILVCKL